MDKPLLESFSTAEVYARQYYYRLGPDRVVWLWQVGSGVFIALLAGLAAVAFFRPQDTRRWLTSDFFFLCLLALGILLVRLPGIFSGYYSPDDEDEWIAAGATLFRDARFWLSVDGSTSGPLVVFPLTLFNYLGLPLGYVPARLLVAFILIVSLLLVYKTLRRLFDRGVARLALLPGVVAMAFGSGTLNRVSIRYNGEHVPMLLTALGLYLYVVLFGKKREKPNAFAPGILLGLGLTLGLFPYAKLQAVPLGLVLGAAAVLHLTLGLGKIAWRGLGWLLAGAVLPSLVVAGYLSAAGVWGDFWVSYVENNLEYARSGLNDSGTSALSLLPVFGNYLITTTAEFGLLFALMLLLLAALPLVYAWGKRRVPAPLQQLLVLAGVLALVALYAVFQPRNFFSHYQILLVLPAVFLTGMSLGCGRVGLPTAPTRPMNQGLFWGIVVSFVLIPTGLCIRRGIDPSPPLGQTDAVSEAIRRYGQPGERLAVWGFANWFYLRASLTMGTRNAHTLYQIIRSGPLQTYYIERYVADLRRIQPALFVDSVTPGYDTVISFNRSLLDRQVEYYPVVARYVAQHYRLAATVQGVRIFLRNDYSPPPRPNQLLP